MKYSLNRGLASNKPIHYLLGHGDFQLRNCLRKIIVSSYIMYGNFQLNKIGASDEYRDMISNRKIKIMTKKKKKKI